MTDFNIDVICVSSYADMLTIEIFGNRQRHHRRVWLDALHPEHQSKYFWGIRPINPEKVADMIRQNRS